MSVGEERREDKVVNAFTMLPIPHNVFQSKQRPLNAVADPEHSTYDLFDGRNRRRFMEYQLQVAHLRRFER